MSTPTTKSLNGTGYDQINVSRMSPEKQALYSQTVGGLQQGWGQNLNNLNQLAAGGNEDYWRQLEAPAHRQFGELQGQIASRFSGMGTGGRHSSGHQLAQSGAATDFAERLQSQRLGLQQNAMKQLQDLYGNVMGTDEFDTFLQQAPKKRTWYEKLFGIGAPVAGGIAGGLLGGPGGALAGWNVGNQFGQAFNGENWG